MAAVAYSGVLNSTKPYLPSLCMLTLSTGAWPGAAAWGKAAMSPLSNTWRSVCSFTAPGTRLPMYSCVWTRSGNSVLVFISCRLLLFVVTKQCKIVQWWNQVANAQLYVDKQASRMVGQ